MFFLLSSEKQRKLVCHPFCSLSMPSSWENFNSPNNAKGLKNVTCEQTFRRPFTCFILFYFITTILQFIGSALFLLFSVFLLNILVMMNIVQSDLCYRCFLRSRGTPWRLYFLQHYFLLERRLHLGEHCPARGHYTLLFILVGTFLLQSESLRLAEKRTSWTVNQVRINVDSSTVCSY